MEGMIKMFLDGLAMLKEGGNDKIAKGGGEVV